MTDSRLPMTLLAVVPLYNMRPTDSIGFMSLIAAAACSADLRLAVLLYDNAPSGSSPGEFPANVRYVAASGNDGLAAAYNRALEVADMESISWLLTLDQDT